MTDGFTKDGETKEQIIEKLISYFKMIEGLHWFAGVILFLTIKIY